MDKRQPGRGRTQARAAKRNLGMLRRAEVNRTKAWRLTWRFLHRPTSPSSTRSVQADNPPWRTARPCIRGVRQHDPGTRGVARRPWRAKLSRRVPAVRSGIVGAVGDGVIDVTLARPIDGLERTGATTNVEARFVAPGAMYRLTTKAKVAAAKGSRITLGQVSKMQRVQRRK